MTWFYSWEAGAWSQMWEEKMTGVERLADGDQAALSLGGLCLKKVGAEEGP